MEVIVSFLALLELMKQRQIRAWQDDLFGEIQIEPGSSWNPDQTEALELEFDE
jgi:chromatin segregation and condensation protein Rec8/ScpA/Scc1 (kleisin family)